MAAGLVLAVTGTAGASTLWGTSFKYWDGSEVWTLDPATGVVDMKGLVGSAAFSDIAVTPSGRVYTVGDSGLATFITAPNGNSVWDFNDLFRLNPVTGQIDQTWADVAPRRFNALTAESETSLLAIEGGGVNTQWGYPEGPHLYRIHLDGTGAYTGMTDLGALVDQPSDGDLAREAGGVYYGGSFWQSGPTSDIYALDPNNVGAETLVMNFGKPYISGLAFDYDTGDLYAGAWDSTSIYKLNLGDGTYGTISLTGEVFEGVVFGMDSVIPEPLTMLGVFLGVSGLGAYIRKRRVL